MPDTVRHAARTTEGHVAEDKGRTGSGESADLDDDADLLGDEPQQDVIFQVRMAVANLFLGHWKSLLYVAGGVLVLSAAYGGYDSYITGVQSDGHAAVARAERALESIDGELSEEEVEAIQVDTAKALEAAAAGTSGAAQAYGYVRAAQVWSDLDDAEAARKAWEKAHSVRATGELGWTTAMGSGYAALAAGDAAVAIGRFGEAAAAEGVLAEQALLMKIEAQANSGDAAGAQATLTELEARFPESARLAEAKSKVDAGSAG